MENGASAPLVGAEIHGFRTAADLDVKKLMADASSRWFRPNEVHAILTNHTVYACLKIEPQPVTLPPSLTLFYCLVISFCFIGKLSSYIQHQPLDISSSGSVLLFDRKVLRNFRKDGYTWKKKKDGKTAQEAHEKLKIGSEERIHVYYARNEDDPLFFRRCYWLLDKNLERIVLVHYRQTSEDNMVDYNITPGHSPDALSVGKKMHHGYEGTPVYSTSGSARSGISSSAVVSEEINSQENYTIYSDSGIGQEFGELYWEDIMQGSQRIDSLTQGEGDFFSSGEHMQYESKDSLNNGTILPPDGTSFWEDSAAVNADGSFRYNNQMSGFSQTIEGQENTSMLFDSMNPNSRASGLPSNPPFTNGIPEVSNGDFFVNQMNVDSLGSMDDLLRSTPILHDHKTDSLAVIDYSSTQQVFNIIDISPSWAYCTEEAKVLVIGHFHEGHKHLEGSKIYCGFGGIYVPAEMVQSGVYRCTTLPQAASIVSFYLTFDGQTPISQVLSFEYRSTMNDGVTSSELDTVKLKREDIEVQIKLAHLLFSTTDTISGLSSKISSKSLNEAKDFDSHSSPLLEKDWMSLLRASGSNEVSSLQNSRDLFELILKNKVQEWILKKVAEGCKTTPRDSHGQGVIHLCAVLDYTWAVHLFSMSGFSLDFRDAFGWTALHWAAYYGREKMVAALLSAGANPSLVTDPTSKIPGGSTASDIASRQGYEGLGVYLAEKGLTAHFNAMSLSGNVSSSMSTKSDHPVNSENAYYQNLSEQELCLQDSLTAYRNAADAAGCIQAAFRDRALKLQTRAVRLANPEYEATNIVAAMRIQHAFRKFSSRNMMKAAARIQSHVRTWQIRKNYLNIRKQAIKIQAAFRGHQVRKQYRKITWSVGVLEKAILRWRLKRKGLRGIQAEEVVQMDTKQEETLEEEEDFYRISREQAEDRVQRSVVRVQAMFRSYQAQQEYRRMKAAHEQAKVAYSDLMGN